MIECLGHSNWTICSLSNQFCSLEFTTFSLLYWGHFLIIPREKGILPTPIMDVTEVIQSLGHINSTSCRLLSQFGFPNFTTFSLLYWGPILITPEG